MEAKNRICALGDKCLCKIKTLVPIGTSRANGKNHADWNSRSMHKKCYKYFIEMKEIDDMQRRLDQMYNAFN